MTSDRPKILAVEDNPETQLLLRHLLQSDYEVTIASGVEEAAAVGREQQFDLLLLDINLGEQRTGVELLDMLQEQDDAPPVPSIALTAYAMPGDREDFLDAGFDAYVSKPFTREDLMDSITSVIGAART